MRLSPPHGQLTAQNSFCFHTYMTDFSYTARGKGPPASSWDSCGFTSQDHLSSLTSDHVDFTTFKNKKQMNFKDNYFFMVGMCIFSHCRKKEFLLNLHLQAIHHLYLSCLRRLGIASAKSQSIGPSVPVKRLCSLHGAQFESI